MNDPDVDGLNSDDAFQEWWEWHDSFPYTESSRKELASIAWKFSQKRTIDLLNVEHICPRCGIRINAHICEDQKGAF